jgi:Xaa-Pro aminopeptidase
MMIMTDESSSAAVAFWPGIRFSDDEYRQRLARLQQAMVHDGVDAAVVSDERTTWFLTGFGDVHRMGSHARPRVLVIPAEGEPTFFVHESTAATVREMVWFDDVRTYSELAQAPVSDIAATARGPGGQVGVELGGQLRPELVPGEVLRLRELLGDHVKDVSAAIWRVRMVKSPGEAERVRKACAITTRAYANFFDSYPEQITERGVMIGITDAIRAEGSDGAWAVCTSGLGQYMRVDGVPRERPIGRGELVFIDCGANVGGYWADFSRAGVVGGPSDDQRRLQAAIWEATCAGVEAIRPGVCMRDVARAVEQVMDRHRLEFSSRAGRYGHGMGLLTTEPPDLSSSDETVIEAGMVLTVEPGVIREQGIFHCEENVLVTSGGCEVLSRAPWELTSL